MALAVFPPSVFGLGFVFSIHCATECASAPRIYAAAHWRTRFVCAPNRSGALAAHTAHTKLLASVLAHLPSEIRPFIAFAAITGWRIASEVLPLEWRRVDFAAGKVWLDAGTTKNGEPRDFFMTADLRAILEAQYAEHLRLKKSGHIVPHVFFREVAEGRGGKKKPQPIVSFNKAWKTACVAAGVPGRIPHDLRRSAIRTFVRDGLSETVAMKMSGHQTPSVFRRYNVTSEVDLLDAARRLDDGAARRRNDAAVSQSARKNA